MRVQNRGQIIDLGVHTLLLIEGGQRVEVEKGVIRDDAAGRLRTADIASKQRRVLNQPRTNLEVAEAIHAAVLDTLRLALAQAGTAVFELNAIAAGVGEKERAIAVAHLGMPAGQHTLAIRNHPVALFRPANNAAGLLEGFGGQ